MATQPVTFRIPNICVTISDRDTKTLLAHLRRTENTNAPGRDCAGAHALIDGARQVPPQTPVPIDLSLAQIDAVLRALEHIRATSQFSQPLARLWNALRGTGPEALTVKVQLGYGGRTQTLFSYSGPYKLGDLLPPSKAGDDWRVVDILEQDGEPLLIAEQDS